jgi:hypothetical protein
MSMNKAIQLLSFQIGEVIKTDSEQMPLPLRRSNSQAESCTAMAQPITASPPQVRFLYQFVWVEDGRKSIFYNSDEYERNYRLIITCPHCSLENERRGDDKHKCV